MSDEFERRLRERILVLDGAMGTMVQAYGLDEAAYRGEAFRDHERDLKGCHDLLCLTRPDVVEEIHIAYLEAGADVVETNSFTATSISLDDYGLAGHAYAINKAAAEVARRAARRIPSTFAPPSPFIASCRRLRYLRASAANISSRLELIDD